MTKTKNIPWPIEFPQFFSPVWIPVYTEIRVLIIVNGQWLKYLGPSVNTIFRCFSPPSDVADGARIKFSVGKTHRPHSVVKL